MNILVVGEEINYDECRAKFGGGFHYVYERHIDALKDRLTNNAVVFDFTLHKNQGRLKVYGDQSIVFADTSTMSLHALVSVAGIEPQCKLFGFCGLPTLFNRPLLEISLYRKEDEAALKKICESLKTEFRIVEDCVGLVAPRIICMIINEAYYTVEEGIATREDIDSAMRLGTNYPFGPFEWCKKIGVKKVYDLISAVYEETKDDRYKISSLLKSESDSK